MSIVVAFDMDGTLLDGRLVLALARLCDAEDKVKAIMSSSMKGYEKSTAIARLWKGLKKDVVLDALSSISLSSNALHTVRRLKAKGCIVGIISDSYTLATDALARMLGMDFSIANTLEYDSNGILTGYIHMPLGWQYIGCTCYNSVCKRYHLARLYSNDEHIRVAVGDSMNDICMLMSAEVSIAYRAKDGIERIAMHFIDDLVDVIDILESKGLL